MPTTSRYKISTSRLRRGGDAAERDETSSRPMFQDRISAINFEGTPMFNRSFAVALAMSLFVSLALSAPSKAGFITTVVTVNSVVPRCR